MVELAFEIGFNRPIIEDHSAAIGFSLKPKLDLPGMTMEV